MNTYDASLGIWYISSSLLPFPCSQIRNSNCCRVYREEGLYFPIVFSISLLKKEENGIEIITDNRTRYWLLQLSVHRWRIWRENCQRTTWWWRIWNDFYRSRKRRNVGKLFKLKPWYLSEDIMLNFYDLAIIALKPSFIFTYSYLISIWSSLFTN